jgi:hypothetical protein
MQTACCHFAGQAGFAVSTKANDQDDSCALLQALCNLGKRVFAHDKLAVGRCWQILVDTGRARTRWAGRYESIDQLFGSGIPGSMEKLLEPIPIHKTALDTSYRQDFNGTAFRVSSP